MSYALFLIAILLGVAGPLCVKILLNQGLGYSELIFWRSIAAIILVLPLAIREQRSIRGLFSRISALRMLMGGAVLSLSVLAYASLSATEVNLISRLDLPLFLLFFGGGERRIVALGAILLALGYSYFPATTGHCSGIAAIWLATIMTAASYWLIRRAAETKSVLALVVPPYLGAIPISIALSGRAPQMPSGAMVLLIVGTAGCAVGLYVVAAKLFESARLGVAELTGCVALLCMYFVEGPVVGAAPSGVVGVVSGVSVIFGLSLVYWEEITKWLKTKAYQQ